METFRMWQMIRFFKKNEISLIEWDMKIEDVKNATDSGTQISDKFLKMAAIILQTKGPKILRGALIAYFTKEMVLKSFETKDKLLPEEIEKITTDAQIRLSNCLDAKFIALSDNQHEVYLTLTGRKFSNILGLVKEVGEDLTDFLGAWKLVLSTAIVTVGLVRFDLVLGAILWIMGLGSKNI